MGDGRESNVSRFDDLVSGMNLIRRNDEEAIARMREQSGGGSALGEYNEKVRDGIHEWSGTGYVSVRSGKNPELETTLENYVQGHSYEKELYRGFDTDRIDNLQAGAIITQGGSSAKSGIGLDAPLSSWSKSRSVAKDLFSGDSDYRYHVLITMPGGTHMGADISADSHFHSEQEVLVSGKSKQRIKKVTKRGNWVYLEVEEVPFDG